MAKDRLEKEYDKEEVMEIAEAMDSDIESQYRWGFSRGFNKGWFQGAAIGASIVLVCSWLGFLFTALVIMALF